MTPFRLTYIPASGVWFMRAVDTNKPVPIALATGGTQVSFNSRALIVAALAARGMAVMLDDYVSAPLVVPWTPASTPPPLKPHPYIEDWQQSEPVLGVTDRGERMVVVYQVTENGTCDWYTTCSERWNVTHQIKHWQHLPPPP